MSRVGAENASAIASFQRVHNVRVTRPPVAIRRVGNGERCSRRHGNSTWGVCVLNGVRGIPSGYLSSLENRLAETEAALFQALSNLHSNPGHARAENIVPDSELLERFKDYNAGQTRTAQIDSWAQLPLTTLAGQREWLDNGIAVVASNDAQLDGSVHERNAPVAVEDGSTRPQTPNERHESQPKRRRIVGLGRDDRQRHELGLMRSEHGSRYVSFVGSASGIHFIRSVRKSIGKGSSTFAASANTTDDDVVPGEDDQLDGHDSTQAEQAIWQPGETSSQTSVSVENLKRWSYQYFKHWHPTLPFLQESSVISWFTKLGRGGASFDAKFTRFQRAIIRSIMSISLADRRQTSEIWNEDLPKVPAGLVFVSYNAATESVQDALKAAPTIESIQAAISVQLFLVTMLRHNAASRLGGLITRMMLQLGLHRCPNRFENFCAEDCVLRKSIFWSIYVIERYLCQSLGMPITIRDDDIDVCFHDEERHQARSSLLRNQDDPSSALLKLLAKHAEVRGIIIELCNKSISHRQADPEYMLQVSAKVAKWANEVDSYLESQPQTHSRPSRLHQVILQVLKDESTITLYRPLLTASKSSPDYAAALQHCVSASRSIIKTLYEHIHVQQAFEEAVLPLCWPSFTWAIWMSAFIVIYAGIEQELAPPVATSLADRSIEILKHISTRGTPWPSACATAVQQLSDRLRERSKRAVAPLPAQPHQTSHTATITRRPFSVRDEYGDASNGGNEAPNRPDVSWSAGYDFAQAQDYASALMPPPLNDVFLSDASDIDLFQGFDIPFWMGDDQYADWMHGN